MFIINIYNNKVNGVRKLTEHVTVKCSSDLLEFWAEDSSSYTEIYDALRARLDANAAFFVGSGRKVAFCGKHFSEIQKRELRMMLSKDYNFSNVTFSDDETAQQIPAPTTTPLPEYLFLTQTVRSGQLVKAAGDITIIGDVNAGAEIIAGGNIAVFGKLRGLVHAGAFGRQDVAIIANKLMANQIRICGKIAVLPQKHKATEPEVVKLSSEGKVIISTLN